MGDDGDDMVRCEMITRFWNYAYGIGQQGGWWEWDRSVWDMMVMILPAKGDDDMRDLMIAAMGGADARHFGLPFR